MPKQIPDLKEKILYHGKEILFTDGYQKLNMRDVAKRCQIAVGTIYNYYASKDLLVASIMLEDWMHTVSCIDSTVSKSTSLLDGLKVIYKEIEKFSLIYQSVWKDSGSSTQAITPDRHQMLIRQIDTFTTMLISKNDRDDLLPISWFISETLLRYASGLDKHFENMEPIITKLIK